MSLWSAAAGQTPQFGVMSGLESRTASRWLETSLCWSLERMESISAAPPTNTEARTPLLSQWRSKVSFMKVGASGQHVGGWRLWVPSPLPVQAENIGDLLVGHSSTLAVSLLSTPGLITLVTSLSASTHHLIISYRCVTCQHEPTLFAPQEIGHTQLIYQSLLPCYSL